MNYEINHLLDEIKRQYNVTSDYKLAQFLGVVNGSIRHYRHGRSLPDLRVTQRIAFQLKIDPDVLYAEFQSQRAPDDFAQESWTRIARRLREAGFAAVMSLVATVFAIVSIAGYAPNAEATALNTSKATSSSMYIMLSRVARFIRALRRAGRATLVHFAQGINHVQSADTDAPYPHAA